MASRTPADAGTDPSNINPIDPLPGERRAKLSLAEFCELIGLDRSTVLRKEREGLLPPRRLVAGMNVFLTRRGAGLVDPRGDKQGLRPAAIVYCTRG